MLSRMSISKMKLLIFMLIWYLPINIKYRLIMLGNNLFNIGISNKFIYLKYKYAIHLHTPFIKYIEFTYKTLI